MSEPMLTIHHRHAAACGIPPSVSTGAADLYIGYFENRHRERWIFTCNRDRSRVDEGDSRRGTRRPDVLGLEHAAIPQERIEDAGEATGEGNHGHLFAAARGDAQRWLPGSWASPRVRCGPGSGRPGFDAGHAPAGALTTAEREELGRLRPRSGRCGRSATS
jgi:hypothetical protein